MKPQDPRQAPHQSKLLVNINAIIVTMQKYVLKNMRDGIKSGMLDRDVFMIELRSGDQVDYTREDVLLSEPGSELWQDTEDVCMVRYSDCFIEIYTFYLFKQMELGHNDYASEMLQDCHSFEPFIPLF